MTLLLGSLMVPLQTQIESRKVTETQKILDNAREALMGYAAAYGYFPCPAAYGGSTGAEATPNDHTAGNGTCPSNTAIPATNVTAGGVSGVYIGYLPAVTLGFTPVDANGYAVDAWGGTGALNRIRYAVSSSSVNSATNCTATPINRPFTSATGIRTATMACIIGTTLLSVCNAAPASAPATACNPTSTALTSNAIAVIWSLGANAATPIGGSFSTQEAQNVEALASADRVFVMRDKSNVAATEFDDIVVWISTPILFSRLLAAGQLP